LPSIACEPPPRAPCLLSVLLACTVGLAPAAEDRVPAFKRGDAVCFVGDSITQGGLYLPDLLLFYATRFPGERFESYNCGIGGDTASGVLRRFDADIAIHKPTVATVMLGMNDVDRGLYGAGRVAAADRARQQAAIDGYARNLEEVVGRLNRLGCRVIMLTPTIYDQTGSQKTPSMLGVNEALGTCAGIVRRLAGANQAPVVDFHGPMNRINAEGQAKDPDFTVVGADRVHPGETGHLVMAYLVLKAQGMTSCVSTIEIDAVRAAAVRTERCVVSDLQAGASAVEFTCLAQSLPFPVSAGARPALDLVPLVADLDREVLSVTGLAVGTYELLIDGVAVEQATAAALAQGVNLALNPRTPQYRQALAVKVINDQRQTLVGQRLRVFAFIEHFYLNTVPGLKPDDVAGVERTLRGLLAEAKAANNGNLAWKIEAYLQWKPRQTEVEREVAEATDGLWKAAQPKSHRYRIRRTG
jgi:lysophospholipase L1-like esterase